MTDGFPRKFGKYHLLAPLAQGGMGALYLSVTGDKGLEKLCVIKTVLPHLADSEYVARFRDEAKVVVKLSHGNLVPVFDAGQEKGEIYLAMDFVEGKDLRAVWNRCAKKGVAFPVDVAVYIAKELCRGLGYAHNFGGLKLVHRDVSPPNVLISFSGEVKLTDFGLASSTLKLEKTAPGVIYGKVSYMSPEQARGEPLDGQTDLYAAGIILWELLTGRQLFPPGDAQPQDLLQRAKDPHPDPPSRRAPRVPPKLDEIVLKALTSDRSVRYQNGEEMRAALAGWLAQEAPATDSARLEKFVTGLFAEDIHKERAEREALVQKTRDRIRTSQHEVVKDVAILERAVVRAAGPQTTKKGIAVAVPEAPPGAPTIVTGARGQQSAAVAQQIDHDLSQDVIGQVIDGRYSVRALIGEGGMGRVYEAEHIQIGKRVALKILHPAYSRTPDVVARFRREARAASKIGHPNIVDVTDSGTTADGSVYFVMEFLEGVELADVIDREGAIDVSRALNIGTQICRALAAAHASGIIHRDLKPENIFLVVREGTTDFVKVLDFGIAKSAELEEQRKERLTHPGMAMGTPEYMAPEQAAGRPADQRSDVYAAGAIMYEMVTGKPPYEGENFMEILTKKATMEPVGPRALRPDLPEVVERVILRALSRSPSDRPPSMEAFEYELTKCLAGRGVAVAKMLGMPVDPTALVESDVAGVRAAMPGGASGLVSMASITSSQETPPPPAPPGGISKSGLGGNSGRVELDGLSALSGAKRGAVEDEDDPHESTQMVRVHSTSWKGIFVWLLILGGVGAGVFWFIRHQNSEREFKAIDTFREETPAPAPATKTASSGAAAPAQNEASSASAAPAQNETSSAAAPVPQGTATSAPEAAVATKPDKNDKTEKNERTEKSDKPDKNEKTEKNEKIEKNEKNEKNEKIEKDVASRLGPPNSKAQADSMIADAREAMSGMEWNKARNLYDRVSRGKFRRADGFLGLAQVAFQTKDADAAIELAQKALGAGGGEAARLLLGHAYLKQGNVEQAVEAYKKVLEKEPGNREAQKGLKEAQKGKAGAGGAR